MSANPLKEPISQEWIKNYVDALLDFASKCDVTMKQAALLRADHAMDLVKAWRERTTDGAK